VSYNVVALHVSLFAAGLLGLLRRDPDLLAMVMGHEIAHALARHNTGQPDAVCGVV
jgi:predicted Zn-dependent protease